MIRLQDIQNALLPVVGWQQDYNPEKQIDNELCQSESGLTFQGAHPLCTLANVRAIMPDDYLYSYPAWNQIMTYKRGTKVRHNGIVWIANYDNTGIVPAATDFNQDFNNDFGSELAGAWVKYDMVSDFVRNLTVNGINTAVQNFIQEKQLQQETKNLLERRTFFDGAARLAATIDPAGKIVGFEIVPVRAMGVTTKIERIGLQMIGATGTVRLYLFHSSQVEPMRVIDLAFTNTKGGFQWFTPSEPIYLPYIPGGDGNGNDAGGAWFLCYNQNELPAGMRALNVSKDWSVEPCQTCLGGLMGLRNNLLTATQGEAIMAHRYKEYQPYKGDIDSRSNGSLVSLETGQAIAYSMNKLLDRGRFFVEPGEEIYGGQVVGEHTRERDLNVNICKTKKLTNVRAAGSDEKIILPPAVKFSLEEALEYIREDEMVEITPHHMRLRKILLDPLDRKRHGDISDDED